MAASYNINRNTGNDTFQCYNFGSRSERCPVVPDTTGVVAFFKDTGATVNFPEATNFNLQTPGQRDSLRAVLSRERGLWQASRPRDYRFLLRMGSFGGGSGWLVMEVRSGQPLRAWDRAGKAAVPTRTWDTLSIDGLFDLLERSADRDAGVQVRFDSRWHFPTYVYTAGLPGPDMWSIIEARAVRPI